MFINGSKTRVSNFRVETDTDITILNLLEKACEGDEKLFFKLIDEQKNLRPHVNVFIGSKNCRKLNGIGSIVSGGDEVSVFPSLSGG